MPSGSPAGSINSNFWSATCDDQEVGLPQVGYVTGQLNVYYVGFPPSPSDEPEQATGWHCQIDQDIIIIRAKIKRKGTLAHELGHSLSLQTHADEEILVSQMDEKGHQVFDLHNIMWSIFSDGNVDDRSKLTKGQSFRANVYYGSALYRMLLAVELDTALPQGRTTARNLNNLISVHGSVQTERHGR
jgi:hypothetical protein